MNQTFVQELASKAKAKITDTTTIRSDLGGRIAIAVP